MEGAQSSMSVQIQENLLTDDRIDAIMSRLIEERMRYLNSTTTTSEETMDRVTEIYDTSLPVDSATGTPPLSSRIIERYNTTKDEQSQEMTESSVSDNTDTDVSRFLVTDKTSDIDMDILSAEIRETGCREEYLTNDLLMNKIGWIMTALSIALLIWVVIETVKHKSNTD